MVENMDSHYVFTQTLSNNYILGIGIKQGIRQARS